MYIWHRAIVFFVFQKEVIPRTRIFDSGSIFSVMNRKIKIKFKNPKFLLHVHISVASVLDKFHAIWDNSASSVKKIKLSITFGV